MNKQDSFANRSIWERCITNSCTLYKLLLKITVSIGHNQFKTIKITNWIGGNRNELVKRILHPQNKCCLNIIHFPPYLTIGVSFRYIFFVWEKYDFVCLLCISYTVIRHCCSARGRKRSLLLALGRYWVAQTNSSSIALFSAKRKHSLFSV